MARPVILSGLTARGAARARALVAAVSAGLAAVGFVPGLAGPVHAEPAVAATQAADAIVADERAQRPSREYLIKAAILFNLTIFATWPKSAFPTADAPVRVCILGDDPFGRALESLRGKQVGRRPVVLAPLPDVAAANMCHVLFVSATERDRIGLVLGAIADSPILTVADFATFSAAGGMVEIAEFDDRTRLEVNVHAARRAGIKLSSKLLRLAETVDALSARSKPSTDAEGPER